MVLRSLLGANLGRDIIVPVLLSELYALVVQVPDFDDRILLYSHDAPDDCLFLPSPERMVIA